MYRIKVRTRKRIELVEITSEISSLLKESKVEQGICLIYLPHTTCGLLINENCDPSVAEDILNWLNSYVPSKGNYRHLEGNADAHIKSILSKNSISLIVEKEKLLLGHWQGIFLAEYDGPREREIWVKFLS